MSNPEQERKDQQGGSNLLNKLRVSGKIIEFKSEGEEKLVCPYCGSTTFIFDYENGQVICAKCGSVVLEHVIDLSLSGGLSRLRKRKLGRGLVAHLIG